MSRLWEGLKMKDCAGNPPPPPPATLLAPIPIGLKKKVILHKSLPSRIFPAGQASKVLTMDIDVVFYCLKYSTNRFFWGKHWQGYVGGAQNVGLCRDMCTQVQGIF